MSCTAESLTPNYADPANAPDHFAQFPITVAFVHDGNWTSRRQQITERGFTQWVRATDGMVTYKLINDPNQAQLAVLFATVATFQGIFAGYDPQKDPVLWASTSVGGNGTLRGGVMRLGVEWGPKYAPDSEFIIQLNAAHEFGHVLGIKEHSTDCGDIMKSGLCGIPTVEKPISPRDLNTLKTKYCGVF